MLFLFNTVFEEDFYENDRVFAIPPVFKEMLLQGKENQLRSFVMSHIDRLRFRRAFFTEPDR